MNRFFEPIFIRRYQTIESELTLDKRLQTLVSISALVSLGNHDFLKLYLEYSLAETLDLEEIQEVILQCYLFAGFPSAIEGFIVLKTIQQESYEPLDQKSSNNIEDWRSQGIQLCKQIYAENFERMMTNMKNLNPDLAEWAIYEGYGKTLSRTGLKPRTRELCAVASLAVNGWERQLYSHCKGAVNCGASKDDVNSALLLAELFKQGVIKKYKYILDHL
ncbi:MAG: carboxymuconolactone decarboxylase family protein [Calditrichaeota bacterium]|nr:carboxymuconolactone decarboxylase family protein [Calditrichota bacterium]